jgi:hypothetical protein
MVFIPRISLNPSGNLTDFAFAMRRRQFPVTLAFAITINKAQGQSAEYVSLHLQDPVFAHGQLYVALSHVISKNCIKALLPKHSVLAETTNIVYPEVLVD